MRCPFCGEEISDKSNVCINCRKMLKRGMTMSIKQKNASLRENQTFKTIDSIKRFSNR